MNDSKPLSFLTMRVLVAHARLQEGCLSPCDSSLRWMRILTTSIRDVEVIAVWIKPKRKVEEVNVMPTCRWFEFAAFLD